MKEMIAIRARVMGRPHLLPVLVGELRSANTEGQLKAAEMLFCVVGQGPARDAACMRKVRHDTHQLPDTAQSCDAGGSAIVDHLPHASVHCLNFPDPMQASLH